MAESWLPGAHLAAPTRRTCWRELGETGQRPMVHHLHYVDKVNIPRETRHVEAQKVFLVGVRKAARDLGVHENTLRRWEERGLIRAVRLPSGVRRFRQSEVAALRERILADEDGPDIDSGPADFDHVHFWTDVPVRALIRRAGARPVTDPSSLTLGGGTEEEWCALYEALGIDR